MNDFEETVCGGIQRSLDGLASGRFKCVERKAGGKSAINKPVDLEIRLAQDPARTVVAIEVADVNTTQLINEVCRLYFDCVPLKLLILGSRNVPPNGVTQCEQLITRFYGQDSIKNTPARVLRYDDNDEGLAEALKDLLLL